MALRFLRRPADMEESNMKMPTKPEEPAKPRSTADRGATFTYAAHAVRKNLSVRVLVQPAPAEPEEQPEHGYGHGV